MSFNYYENTNFINNRNRKRTLILDVDDSGDNAIFLGEGSEFNIQLYEPLRIDKHSEIYLDNFLSINSNISTGNDCAFVLKINEFNMNSNVASTHGITTVTSGNPPNTTSRTLPGGQNIFNSLIIPNEHRDPSNNHSAVIHKGKKFNYVCDINPQTISSLSGRITNLNGDPMFHGFTSGGRFTYSLTNMIGELVLVSPANDFTFPLQPGDIITDIDFGSTGLTVGESSTTFSDESNGSSIVATSAHDTSTLHFALTSKISGVPSSNGTITFSIVRSATLGISADVQYTHDSVANPNLHLVEGNGRFIAEFSIVSRE